MTVFFLCAGAMLAFAFLLVLPPLLRKRAAEETLDADDFNVGIARQRLTELQQERALGRISEEQFALQREELERSLLHDITGPKPPQARNDGRWVAGLIVLFIPALAFGVYFALAGNQMERLLAAQTGAAAGAEELRETIAAVKQRLAEDPQDVKSWVVLGLISTELGAFEQAAQAYRHALHIVGEDADLLVEYAYASARSGSPASDYEAALERALRRDPKHQKALWLGGFFAFNHKDYVKAVELWERLLAAAEMSAEDARPVQEYLALARTRMQDGPATAPVETADVAEALEASISVRVSLDEALRDKALDDDSVFIFARAEQGPPMPLAVARAKVRDLPVEVTLTDSMAMMPAMRLSKFEKVIVGARISKSGEARAQAGDLQGISGPVPTRSKDRVALVIDQVL